MSEFTPIEDDRLAIEVCIGKDALADQMGRATEALCNHGVARGVAERVAFAIIKAAAPIGRQRFDDLLAGILSVAQVHPLSPDVAIAPGAFDNMDDDRLVLPFIRWVAVVVKGFDSADRLATAFGRWAGVAVLARAPAYVQEAASNPATRARS